MATYTISFADQGQDSSIEAAYYKHEDGWITFKDAEHKVLAATPEHCVRLITAIQDASVKPVMNFTINNPAELSIAEKLALKHNANRYT